MGNLYLMELYKSPCIIKSIFCLQVEALLVDVTVFQETRATEHV